MSLKYEAIQLAKQAKAASRKLAPIDSAEKNRALHLMADRLEARSEFLLAENEKDLDAATKAGLSSALLDRIALDPGRVRGMAKGLRDVVALPDPVREITKMWRRPNGLQVGRMRIPLGVIGIIYEARPNVTSDAASLCLKAGNAVILRGGSEAINSNRAIVSILSNTAEKAGLPGDVVTFIDNPDRQAVKEMLKLEELIDLIIPRGGEGLIRAVVDNSKIPVIKHYKGVCHVYVDNEADLKMADKIVTNNYQKAMRFLREVDSSAVFVNASTRLNDGFQFGLGAEIGISTTRIHARGPMGLEELTCTKFIVLGNGQLRE